MLAGLLGSALIGAVVGAASVAIADPPAEAPAPQARWETDSFEQELAALRMGLVEAVERLEAIAREERPVDPSPRVPIGPAEDGGTDPELLGLDQRLDRLIKLLERMPRDNSMIRRPTGQLGLPDFPEKAVVNSREFRDSILLWDYARVAERFGYPDVSGISNNGYVYWRYTRPEGGNVQIYFKDGVVLRVRE